MLKFSTNAITVHYLKKLSTYIINFVHARTYTIYILYAVNLLRNEKLPLDKGICFDC